MMVMLCFSSKLTVLGLIAVGCVAMPRSQCGYSLFHSTDDSTTITIETSVPFTGHKCEPPSRSVDTTPKELMTFFTDMALMRRMDSLYKSKLIRGFCHLCDGQINSFVAVFILAGQLTLMFAASWENITKAKADGGLWISKLVDVNAALLAKWSWRFYHMRNSMWRRVIEAIHGGKGRWTFLPVDRTVVSCWKNNVAFLSKMLLKGRSIQKCIRADMGQGNKTRFWLDLWLFWLDLWFGDTLLKDRWRGLFKLEKEKRYMVSERVCRSANGYIFLQNWSRFPQTVYEISEMQELSEVCSKITFSNRNDRWVWKDAMNGEFSVAQVKKLLRADRDVKQQQIMRWEHWVPLKINLFIWRAEMDRIPTREALIKRRIDIHDTSCVLCSSATESTLHQRNTN